MADNSDDTSLGKEENEIERTRRLLTRLQLNLPDAEQQLDSANGSLWDEHRGAPRLWHREIAESIQRKCTGKQGVDVVLENVVSDTFGESLRSTAQNAIVVVLGNIGAKRVEIDPGLVIVRRIRISGSGNATYKDVEIALHLLATGAVKPFIGAVLPFPRASEGHAMMEQRTVVGRVVLSGW